MNSIVLFKSKTGYSKKYAEWIAREIKADLMEASNASPESLSNYDVIVFGAGLYAGGINGIGIIKKNLELLKEKKTAVFAVGAAKPDEKVIREIREKNFSSDELKKIKFFYLRGGFNFQKLGFLDKFLMLLMKLHLKTKKELTADDQGLLNAYKKPVDFTKKENIAPIISFIKNE